MKKALLVFLSALSLVSPADATQLSPPTAQELQEEADALKTMIATDPKNPNWYFALGSLLMDEEHPNDAERLDTERKAEGYLKKAVELDPKLHLAWYRLALLHLDSEEGNTYLKKAIEANPQFPPPYYWLAYAYCRHRKDVEAVPLLQTFLKVAHGDPDESARLRTAEKILEELRSGTDGEQLERIRETE